MRRVFIIRKDLHLKPGKLSAMIGHLCEAFWTNLMKAGHIEDNESKTLPAIDDYDGNVHIAVYKDPDLMEMSIKAYEAGLTNFTYKPKDSRKTVTVQFEVPKDVWEKYVNGIFRKTICECRNLNQLKKAEAIALELGLKKNVDFGYINDRCFTDLTPENPDGTCTIGIWFRPLEDDIAHKISKKFQLYREEHATNRV